MTNVRHKSGVTLVEILVVVGIIGLLAGLVITITRRLEHQSNERAVANVFALLNGALQEYYEDMGTFPVQPERDYTQAAAYGEVLYAQLDSVPASRQVLKQIDSAFVRVGAAPAAAPRIYDSWGTALCYFYTPDSHFPELLSAGPDGTFGTDDDISSRRM